MRGIMKTNYLLITLQAILMLVFNASALEALEVTAELHLAEDLPKELQGKVLVGKYYTLIKFKDWPADQTVDIFEERLIDKDANRKVDKGSMPSIPEKGITTAVGAIGYLPGEPTVYTFNSHKKITEQVKIVPYPIFDVSEKDEAKIYVIMNSLKSYCVELSGFNKDEDLLFDSESYDEKITTTIPFVSDIMPILYRPAVKGKKGGISKISVRRESGEVLKVEIPWGLELCKYLIHCDSQGHLESGEECKEFLKKYPSAAEYFNKS